VLTSQIHSDSEHVKNISFINDENGINNDKSQTK